MPQLRGDQRFDECHNALDFLKFYFYVKLAACRVSSNAQEDF